MKKSSSFDYRVWSLDVNSKDHLEIGGCDCVDLGQEYNTPLFVIDENKMIGNLQRFWTSFRRYKPETEIYYSYKTNPVPWALNNMHFHGAGAEVISPYELWLALDLGVSPEKIIYNGPYKPVDALETAISRQVKLINIESFSEIEAIDSLAKKLGKKQDIGIRVCSKWGWAGKFGFRIENGEAFAGYEQCARRENLRIRGIHTHLGSGLKKSKPYLKSISLMIRLIKEIKDRLGVEIDYLDIGGGFGVATVKNFSVYESLLYRIGLRYPNPPKLRDGPEIETIAKQIAEHLEEKCHNYRLKVPILIIEPGRAITSSAQLLLLKANPIKARRGRQQYVIMDGGINVAFPMRWEYHEIFLANRMSESHYGVYAMAGPLCTPIDFLCQHRKMPNLANNDLIAVMDTGAYFIPFSFHFSFPRPAVICVKEGRHAAVQPRESFEDMVKLGVSNSAKAH